MRVSFYENILTFNFIIFFLHYKAVLFQNFLHSFFQISEHFLNMWRIVLIVHQDLIPGVVMHTYGYYMKREHHEGGLRQHLCDKYPLFNICT